MNFIEEYVLEKILDEALKGFWSLIKERKYKTSITKNEIEKALNIHLNYVQNWSREISFRDSYETKSTTNVYVELDFYLTPLRVQIKNESNSIQLKKLFQDNFKHLIILGQPGAGKTTSLKQVCQQVLHDENFNSEKFTFPILIRLADLNSSYNSKGIIFNITDILGLKIDFEVKDDESEFEKQSELKLLKDSTIQFIDDLKVILVLDGFDELNDSLKKDCLSEIRELSLKLNQSKLILTCRSGDFHYSIENATTFEIRPLNECQIKRFAIKWLHSNEKAAILLNQIYDSPFADTAIRPLTLAHLCAIFEKYGEIPEKPKTVYNKIVKLLLEEWDLQRSIKRKSKYADFELDRKFDFLTSLAYDMTISYYSSIFNRNELVLSYKRICDNFNLPKEQYEDVVSELETHNGLFLKSGYDEYEFAHKSLQEYLAADYIVRLPQLVNKSVIFKLPNELALAIAISSNSTLYLANLILVEFTRYQLTEDFLDRFIHRLVLEKPDFNQSPILGLAFLKLFTFCIALKGRTYIKFCEHQLDEIASLQSIKRSIENLKPYYIANESPNKKEQIFTLKQIKKVKSDLVFKQPITLFTKRIYFEQ